MTNREKRPALPARIASWGITFLLTVTLTISVFGGPAAYHRILTNEELHVHAATEEPVIREQTEKIADTIREMAKDYSFSADAVISMLSSEELADINDQAARWWTRIVSDGIMDEIPAWTAGEQMVSAVSDTLDMTKVPEDEREETAKGIVNEIEKEVNRTVMPFRKALVTVAVRYVNRKTDLPGIIRLVSAVPVLAAAISLFFAGVIAFLTGKGIRFSLKYYGSALAGAGLSALAGILLIRNADIGTMIRAASDRLEHQVQAMLKSVIAETWICAAILFAAGMACLIIYNHEPVQREKEGRHAKKENTTCDQIAKDQGTAPAGRRRRSAQRAV